jgi:hypothetical protein
MAWWATTPPPPLCDRPARSAYKSKSTDSKNTFTTYLTVDVQALYLDKTIISVLVASMFGPGASVFCLLPPTR